MTYYSEEEMKTLRRFFEEIVLHWPNVQTKKMFGCPSYQVNGKLFAFFVTNGLVLTNLTSIDRENLSKRYVTSSFQVGKRIVQKWVQLPLTTKEDIDKIIGYIQKSYNEALKENKDLNSKKNKKKEE